MKSSAPGTESEVAPLPALATQFDAEGLVAHTGAIVIVDARGVMLWMNPAWSRYAKENQGAKVLETHGIGTLYYDGIVGPLRDYYECEFELAARTGEPFEQVYECSSRDVQRLMRLRALPLRERGLLLEHSCVREIDSARPEVVAPLEVYVGEHKVIVQCGNCRRVRRSSTPTWDWVPAWLTERPAPTSHAICEVCLGFYWGERLHAARSRAGMDGDTK